MIISEILQWVFIALSICFNLSNGKLINTQARIVSDFFNEYYK